MRRLTRCLAVAGFAAMNIMLLSVSVWSGNATDITPETRDFFHWASALIALPAAAYSRPAVLPQRLARAARALRSTWMCRFRSASSWRLAMSVIETAHHARDAYYDSAIMLLFFLLVGRTLDHAMRRKTRAVAGNLAALKAETAHRFMGDEIGQRAGGGAARRRPPAGQAGRARAGRRRGARRRLGDRRQPDHRRDRAPQGRSRRHALCRQHEPFRRAHLARDRRRPRHAAGRDRAAAGKSGEREVAHDAARRPRLALLRAAGARGGGADAGRLAAGRGVPARRPGDRHRRAHHHLPLRAGAGGSGGAGGGLRRACSAPA